MAQGLSGADERGGGWRRDLGGLRKLQRLEIDTSSIADDDLAYLNDLTDLQALSLSKTNVTDRGVRQLLPLAGLRQLNLADTPVTDAALVHLEHDRQCLRRGRRVWIYRNF